MKNMVRAFVIALALTSAAASTQLCLAGQQNPNRLTASKASAFPIPSCPLDDPNACGISGPNPSVVRK